MGYSTFVGGPKHGKICCDHCPAGVGRKRSCPYGYCGASYLCADCWKGPAKERFHRWHDENGCQEKHVASEAIFGVISFCQAATREVL